MILVLGILLKALIILAVFSVLIIVHEAGHFFAAKKSGVKVERFALGFGKKIFGIKKGETEYLLNIIPLGGYVKLAGEDPYERKGKVDEFYSKPIKSRLGILLSGPLFNYIFAFPFTRDRGDGGNSGWEICFLYKFGLVYNILYAVSFDNLCI